MATSRHQAKKAANRSLVIKNKRLGFKPSTKKKIKKLCLGATLFLLVIVIYEFSADSIGQRSNKLASDSWYKAYEVIQNTRKAITGNLPQKTNTASINIIENEQAGKTLSAVTPFFNRASTFAKPLGFLPKGTELIVTESKNNWVKIKGDGMWVRRSDLSIEGKI